jgi:hypothetical protein
MQVSAYLHPSEMILDFSPSITLFKKSLWELGCIEHYWGKKMIQI